MTFKKLTGILLAASITLTVFSGCSTTKENLQGASSQTSTQTPVESKKDVGITAMFASGVVLDDPQENVIGKVLHEKTGVYLKSQVVADTSGSGDLTKLQLAFASGDLPDIVNFNSNQPGQFEFFQKLIKDEQIIDLKSYINENTPNLKKIVDSSLIYSKLQIKPKTDPIYCVIQGYPESDKDISWFEPVMTVWAREDWLKIVNIDVANVKDANDLYSLLKAFKEKIPNVNNKPIIPTTLGENGAWWNELSKSLAAPWFSYVNGKIMTQHLEPIYLEQMSWLAKLYSEGLLDKEAYTHKANVFAEKVTSGRVGVFTSGINDIITKYNPELEKSVPGAKFVPLYNLVDQRQRGEDGKAEAGIWYQTPDIQGYTVVTKAAKDPEAIIKFFEYIASDEGQLLVNLGTKGVIWEDVDGKPCMQKDIYDLWAGDGKKTIMAKYGLSVYNLAGNTKVYEITGGDQYSWQLIDKNSDEYKFRQVICKERRTGIQPDPTSFVITMSEFGDMANVVYAPITPMQNKALIAKSGEEAKTIAKQLQDKATELGMQKFLDTATQKYNEIKQTIESSK